MDFKWLNNEEKYKIYNDGKIFSVKTNKFLIPNYNKISNKLTISLVTNNKNKKYYLHNLIYKIFNGEINKSAYIIHIDNNIYSDYKANREGKEWYKKIDLTPYELRKQQQEKESYLWQMVRVKNYLEDLFIRQVQVDQIESDDMIAYYCQKYNDKEKITIYTNDRDICQLLEYDNVSVYLANLKQNVTKKNYYLLFKHHYSNLTVIKTMCGDDSDNISGIDGLGEDTLIKHFPKIQTEKVRAATIIKEAREINEQRISNKKKPLKVLENIVEGIFKTYGKVGLDQYKLNYKIINLLEPFLTKEAMAELVLVAEEPLDPNGRGEENLLKMMTEDAYLENYNSDFIRFHEPFYPVIIREKDFYKKNTHI